MSPLLSLLSRDIQILHSFSAYSESATVLNAEKILLNKKDVVLMDHSI